MRDGRWLPVSGTDPEALLFITPHFAEGGEHPGEEDLWLLERRHQDHEHWVEIQRFPSKELAEMRLERLVDSGVPRSSLRVERVHLLV
jgi:hypothetical protein